MPRSAHYGRAAEGFACIGRGAWETSGYHLPSVQPAGQWPARPGTPGCVIRTGPRRLNITGFRQTENISVFAEPKGVR